MKNASICRENLACEEVILLELRPLGIEQAGLMAGQGPGKGPEKDPETRYAEMHLQVSCAAWQNSLPGNFVMLRPSQINGQPVPLAWGYDLIWARAFSICRVEKSASGEGLKIVLFMQLVGRGTPRLLGLTPGDKLLMWGPLGNSFAVAAKKPTLMLAGGLGVAPFVGYCLNHPAPLNLRLEFGHRVGLNSYPLSQFPGSVLFNSHLEQNKQDLQDYLGLIKNLITDYALQNSLILACGPHLFLKYIHQVALAAGAGDKTQLSLETQMACGSGACLGCTVKAAASSKFMPKNATPEIKRDGWPIQVCLHGPVFWANEVNFD